MIHVATTFWNDPQWIDIQLGYLNIHIAEDFRVYAFLNGFDTTPHRSKFFYASTEILGEHAVKLNLLADVIISHKQSDDDLILFIDGDAFPIGDIAGFARAALADFPLLAVQRLENDGEMHPHPCFCMTTVGFWRRLGGDWKEGFQWKDIRGEMVTDVGGNLLGQLNRAGIRWLPLHRSNRVNLHPLWFAVYHNLVYHHGAGFVEKLCRKDGKDAYDLATLTSSQRIQAQILNRITYRRGFGWMRRFSPTEQRAEAQLRHTRFLHAEMMESLKHDPTFYRRFIGTGLDKAVCAAAMEPLATASLDNAT
jgi:hypothetical protein